MKRFIYPLLIFSGYFLLQGCTGTRRFATTIERDEKNPCQINMIIQIGIAGTDADVQAVKADLDACFGKGCFIPCPNDSTRGCMTKITTVVKKWSTLNEDEERAFHYVQMVDNDGLPSTAYIGRPNVAGNTEDCQWRRNEFPGTYCHEVLHLCGLYDKYCARIYDSVTNTVVVERDCTPPVPGSTCCAPSRDHRRCTFPCPGHEDDIMGTSAPMKCSNIMDVLKGVGLDNCPPECCGSDSTFTRPLPEYYIIPGYLNFGEKDNKLGHFGIGTGFNYKITPSIGVTIDAGVYIKTEKQEESRETSRVIKVTGGGSWQPGGQSTTRSSPIITTHFMAGILNHRQRFAVNDVILKNSKTFFCLDIGASIDWKLNRSLSVRMLQADYLPTFSDENTMHNFRLSAGLVLKLGR